MAQTDTLAHLQAAVYSVATGVSANLRLLGVGAMSSRSEPISSSSSSTSSLNDSFSLLELMEESTVKNKGREGGRREGGLKQYFHRGYHQIGQGTVYTKLHVGQSKLQQKSTGAQLFSANKYWGTAI